MRTRVFIDGEWLHKTSGNLGFETDFKALRALYEALEGESIALDYFQIEAIKEDGKSTLRRLLDWLDCNGYRVHAIPIEIDIKNSIRDARTELMVLMAAEIFQAAERGADDIVIWSGDRALVPAINAAKRAGAAVTVVLEKRNCAGTLMRAADELAEIAELRDTIRQPDKQKASA